MAVLNKPWESADRLVSDKKTVTGESADAAKDDEERAPANQAMLVYVVDPSGSEGFDKVEKVVLMDDKVCIAMHAFRCIKMTPDAAAGDPFLEEHGDEVPRFVVITPDYEKAKVIEGNSMSASKLYKAMKYIARKSYKQNLDRNVDKTLDLLREFDRIANERKLLADKEQRADGDLRELEDIKEESAELDERQKKADAERDELLAFTLKT